MYANKGKLKALSNKNLQLFQEGSFIPINFDDFEAAVFAGNYPDR